MFDNRVGAAVLIAKLALLSSSPLYALEPDQIFDKVSSSIVLVLALDQKTSSQGSGVVIAPRRVITNCHVVNKRDRLFVKWGELQLPASLEYADTSHDLCQLSVPDLRAPAVSMRKLSTVRVGQRAYAIGNPEGLELTLTEGLVSAIRTIGGRQWIQTSALFTYGSSGGGLFDTEGRLIGLTSSGVKEGAGLNFAIPADYVSDVSARIERSAPVQPPANATEMTATKGKQDGFPRLLNGAEIVTHLAHYKKIEVNRGHKPFILKIHFGSWVERECLLCRVRRATGTVTVKRNQGLVCFKWFKTTYPDSGCFQLVETSTDRFLIRPVNQEVTIMEYSINP